MERSSILTLLGSVTKVKAGGRRLWHIGAEKGSVYRVLVGKSGGKKPLRRSAA